MSRQPSKPIFIFIEGLNAYATAFYFNYLFFFMGAAHGWSDRQNLALSATHGFIYIFAAITVGSAFAVISARNPVHSVLFLILAFFNAAGLFVLMGAEFLAMLLVVVYVGAVAVLFLFVVALLPSGGFEGASGTGRMIARQDLVLAGVELLPLIFDHVAELAGLPRCVIETKCSSGAHLKSGDEIAIVRGPLGLAFQALRDNPAYAMSRGVSKFKYQLWVFGLSAFFTGLAGAFYAAQFGVVGPIVFSIAMLLFLLSMIVVGGMGTIWGPLLGAAVLMLADEGMRELGDWRDIGLGLVLAGFVILLPRGLAGIRSPRSRAWRQETE